MTTTEETTTEYISDTSRRGLTRGLAELTSDGFVRKNPEPILGETYLTWSDGVDASSPVFIATYCGLAHGEPDARLFAMFAYVPQPHEEESALDIRTLTNQPNLTDRVWVKAHFGPVHLNEEQMDASLTRSEELRRELMSEQQWFDEFSEAMNNLAESKGWCPTYDDIVRSVGLPGREQDYWVEVEARVTVTDNSPSSALDTLLEEHYGSPVVTSSVSFTGKVTVRVESITAHSPEAAREHVDREAVDSALADQFSGTVELDDWEVRDSGLED